jgi:hypothetical protein
MTVVAYLRCALVGIGAGVAAVVTWGNLRFVMANPPIPIGGTAAVVIGLQEILLAGIVGFALGFYLMWRRQRTRTAKP